MNFAISAAIIIVILTTLPAKVQGQGQSFGEVLKTLRRGESIRVDVNGGIVDGRVDAISGSSLRLLRKKEVLDLQATEIRRIKRSRHEPDGILIGLGLGAAAGLGVVALRCNESSERSDCRRVGSLVVVGPTAAAGALIDRAFRKFDTIFDRTTMSSRQLRISPILGVRHQGVAITLLY